MLFLLFFLLSGGFFVNRTAVLVLYLCRFEHLVPFSLFACVFVIARLAVDFWLIEIGVEIAGIRPVVHINDEAVREDPGMTCFGKRGNKESHDQNL